MKNKKWLTYTAGILLTLIVLAVVGGAGFRIGMMQTASFTRAMNGKGPAPSAQNLDGEHPQITQGNPHGGQGEHGNRHNQGYERHGRGGFIFGLFHLVILGLLIWVVYKLIQKSGWRLTRVAASPAPAVSETPSVEVEEKKESE